MQAILQLKYRPDRRLAAIMAGWLVNIYRSTNSNVSLVIPVPLGRQRLRERGYNQANLLAQAFAGQIKSSYSDMILERHRETASQVGLDVVGRWENVRAAFVVQNHSLIGQTIVIIDDLFTTGATLSACADALYDAGANSIIGLTVGRA